MGWAERDLDRKGSVDLEALEFGVRDRMRQVGARVLEEVLNSGEKVMKEVRCPAVAEVAKRGLAGARIIVVLGDGAPWIWVVAEEHFPMAIQILDLYHARQHLWTVGRAAFAKDEEELKRWMNKRIAELDLGDIPALVHAFQQLPVHDERSVETIRTEIDFFEKNQQRMRYAYFRSLGLFVGSGVIEAGCKSVNRATPQTLRDAMDRCRR